MSHHCDHCGHEPCEGTTRRCRKYRKKSKGPDERYRVLFISDVHMSNSLPHALPGEDGITNRLRDQIKLWDGVVKRIEKGQSDPRRQIDHVAILGDLFDKSHPSPVTLAETVRCVVNIPCPVAILAGNHDAEQATGGRFNVEVFDAMGQRDIIYLRAGEPWNVKQWLHFHPVPFCPSEVAMEQIGATRTVIREHGHPDDQHVLLLHHSIVGCEHLGWTCDDGLDAELICEDFDAVISGHFHQTQRFGPDLQGLYLGSPMHHDYGDVEREASYWVFTFRKGKDVHERMVDPGLPKFHKIVVKDGIWPTWEPEERPAGGDYLRAEVHATHAEWIALKPQISEECVRLRDSDGIHATFKHKPIYQHAVRLEASSKSSKKTMEDHVRGYVKSATTGDLDPKALLALGKSILREARAH